MDGTRIAEIAQRPRLVLIADRKDKFSVVARKS